MGDVIFVRSRHNYESYVDMLRLIELSGYPLIYIDEIQAESDNTYILLVLNGEVGEGWRGAKARIIHYNLEWFRYPPVAGVAETWHFDEWYAGEIGARYVPLGGHGGLAKYSEGGFSDPYDVAFIGYMIPRREAVRHDLLALGFHLTPSSLWGLERHIALGHSRCYLHVHQHPEKPGLPALRMVVAAAYKLPVISEIIWNRGIYPSDCFLHADIRYLAPFVQLWLNKANATMMRDYGQNLYQFLCADFPFRTSIERAV